MKCKWKFCLVLHLITAKVWLIENSGACFTLFKTKKYKLEDIFKSITFDHGVEFAKRKQIQDYLHTTIYFAHPHSSFERGSNENGNKLLHIFSPITFIL